MPPCPPDIGAIVDWNQPRCGPTARRSSSGSPSWLTNCHIQTHSPHRLQSPWPIAACEHMSQIRRPGRRHRSHLRRSQRQSMPSTIHGSTVSCRLLGRPFQALNPCAIEPCFMLWPIRVLASAKSCAPRLTTCVASGSTVPVSARSKCVARVAAASTAASLRFALPPTLSALGGYLKARQDPGAAVLFVSRAKTRPAARGRHLSPNAAWRVVHSAARAKGLLHIHPQTPATGEQHRCFGRASPLTRWSYFSITGRSEPDSSTPRPRRSRSMRPERVQAHSVTDSPRPTMGIAEVNQRVSECRRNWLRGWTPDPIRSKAKVCKIPTEGSNPSVASEARVLEEAVQVSPKSRETLRPLC
jgi:hypothetical protein